MNLLLTLAINEILIHFLTVANGRCSYICTALPGLEQFGVCIAICLHGLQRSLDAILFEAEFKFLFIYLYLFLIDGLCKSGILQVLDILLDSRRVIIVELSFFGNRGMVFRHNTLQSLDGITAFIYGICVGVDDTCQLLYLCLLLSY